MANLTRVFSQVRKVCLSFPGAVETDTWGKPHFRINDKIFAGCGEEDGKVVLGFKLEMDHAKAIIATPGFSKAPYVGHKGWVSMDVTDFQGWEFVRELVGESYRLIAPKKSLEKLGQATKKKARKKK